VVDGDGNTTIRGNVLFGDGTNVKEAVDSKMSPEMIDGEYQWSFDKGKGIAMSVNGSPLFQITDGSLWMKGTGIFTGGDKGISATIGKVERKDLVF
jgi:hypothetical protein